MPDLPELMPPNCPVPPGGSTGVDASNCTMRVLKTTAFGPLPKVGLFPLSVAW